MYGRVMSTDEPFGTLNTQIGQRLRRAREAREMSAAQVADLWSTAVGKEVQDYTVRRLELGTRPTTVQDLEALSGIYEISIADLVEPESVVSDTYTHLKQELRFRSRSLRKSARETLKLAREVEYFANRLLVLLDLMEANDRLKENPRAVKRNALALYEAIHQVTGQFEPPRPADPDGDLEAIVKAAKSDDPTS